MKSFVLFLLIAIPLTSQAQERTFKHTVSLEGAVGISDGWQYEGPISTIQNWEASSAVYFGLNYEYPFTQRWYLKATIGYGRSSYIREHEFPSQGDNYVWSRSRVAYYSNDLKLGATYWLGNTIQIGLGGGFNFSSAYLYSEEHIPDEGSAEPEKEFFADQDGDFLYGYYLDALIRIPLADRIVLTTGVQFTDHLKIDDQLRADYAIHAVVGAGYRF